MRIFEAENKEHINTLASIIRLSFKDVAEKFGLTKENCPNHPSNCTADWIEKDLAKGVTYYILEHEKVLCACFGLEKVNDSICYLERLAVLPQYRRVGLGKRMVEYAFQKAIEMHCRRMEIGIIAEHAELAGWYEKLGFIFTDVKTFEHLPFKVAFMYKQLS